MTDGTEHARVIARWEAGADGELIARMQRFFAELPRRFEGLELMPPIVASQVDIVLVGASLTLADRALNVASSIREESVSIGLSVELAVDLLDGLPSTAMPRIPSGRSGEVAVAPRVAERLSETQFRELRERGGSWIYPRSSSDLPPHRLPRRFVRPGSDPVEPGCLREGLLDLDRAPAARPLDSLWREFGSTVLVVAEPWGGKTYCARELVADQRRRVGPDRVFHLDLARRERSLDATAWASWCDASVDGYAVVDGLDEAHFRGEDLGALLAPLLDARWSRRLRAIAFTRDDGSREVVQRAVTHATPVRLLPVDPIEAARDLGGDRLALALQRARELRLQGALSIERLRGLASEHWTLALDEEDLLRSLCQEGTPDLVTHDEVLVASRMGAVSLLCDVPAFELQLQDWLTARIVEDRREVLRALRRSALFVGVAGGYAFRSRHARDLFAARALRDVRGAATARSLLTDETGRPRAGLDEVVASLRSSPSPPEWLSALDDWQRTPLPLLSDDDALAVLDALLAHSGASLLYLPGYELLERIDRPAVRARALATLRDATEERGRRLRMFELAVALKWDELATIVDELASAEREDPVLRREAVWALDADRVSGLVPFADIDAVDDVTAALRDAILCRLVHAGLMPALQAAARIGERGPVRSIAGKLTDTEIAELLGRASGRLARALPPIDARRLDELFDAVEPRVVLIPWDEAVAADVAALLNRQRILDVRLDPTDAEAQSKHRLLYLALIDSPMGYVASNALDHDRDVEWLLELASAREELEVRLAGDLRQALWRLPEEDSRRSTIEHVLRVKAPETWAEYEETERRRPEWRAEHERWSRERAQREAAAAAATRALADVVDQALALEPAARIHGLAELCFVDDAPSFSNVVGRFADLPVDRRRAIVAEVRTVLAQVEPSIVPVSSPFSSRVLAHAAAFREAVRWDDDDSWLGESIVRAWLPLVLFDGRFQRAGPARGAVERCLRRHPEATIEVLVDALERETRAASVGIARSIPDAAWSLLAHPIASLLEDESLSSPGRAALLAELLDERSLAFELRAVLRRQAQPGRSLRLEAIAGLVLLDPVEGLRLACGIATDAPTLARTLGPLIDRTRHRGGAVRELLTKVDTSTVVALTASLFRHLPFDDPRPVGEVYWVGDDDRLYDLRLDLVALLASRDDFDGPQIDALVAAIAEASHALTIRAHIQRLRDRDHVARLLDGLRFVPARPSAAFVLDALAGGSRSRFQSEADLLYVVARGLRDRAGETLDYQQLVRGTDRRGGALRTDWPHEHSLQAYVELRVKEILRLAGRDEITLVREPQEAAGRDRLDFLCVGVARDDERGERMELPIEVKWSHNDEWLQSLTAQLGQRYVLDKGRTRGLYVVGFTGEGRTASQHDLAVLTNALEAARDAFQTEYEGTELAVVVLPCVPS